MCFCLYFCVCVFVCVFLVIYLSNQEFKFRAVMTVLIFLVSQKSQLLTFDLCSCHFVVSAM